MALNRIEGRDLALSARILLSKHSIFTFFEQGILKTTQDLQKQVSLISTQSPTQKSVDVAPCPDSVVQWLIGLLNLLAGIMNRNEDLSLLTVTETEYQQLLAVMDDLIYGVGDDENHPLSAVMALVGTLIKAYEDQHFPKLVDLYPELAKKASDKATAGNRSITSTISGQINTDFVVVFFLIGCLLWKGGKAGEAISAYDLAVRIDPNYASVYASRGEAKSDLNDLIGAKADFQNALKLTEKQGEKDFSVAIEERLQELDVVEAIVAYFSEPRFAKFSTLRECKIQMGPITSRADIVLRDTEGNFVAIAECKLPVETNYDSEPLKSFLCATDTSFGIFATGTNRDSWIFYENLRRNRFQQIEQSDFERRILE